MKSFSSKKIFHSKLFLVIEISILILIFWSLEKEISRERKFRKEISKLREEVLDIEEKNKQYLEEMNYLKSKAFLEKEAREKLFLKKRGEKIIILTDKEKIEEESEEKRNSLPEKINSRFENLKKWRSFFTQNR